MIRWVGVPFVPVLVLVACTPTPVPRDDPAAEGDRPNILLFVTDDQRDGTMSMMPDVERWFGSGGTRFENAYTTTPACCPARASILSGM
ncbi:MAG: sulfatase-like hydrolase/transferase, partial [Actinomycetota bacterium]